MSLKVDLKSQETSKISFDYGWIFVFVFILFAFVIFYSAGLRLQKVTTERKQELQTWKDKVAGFSGMQGKLDVLKGEIGSIQEQITQMRELRYDPLRYSILLARLSRLLPQNLWIGSLSIEPSHNQMVLTGSAIELAGRPPLASLAEFLRNLQNDKDNYFSDIVLQGTSTSEKSQTWVFNMQASYNVPLIKSEGGQTFQTGNPVTPSVSPANPPLLPSPQVSPSPAPSIAPSPKPLVSPAQQAAPEPSPTPSASASPTPSPVISPKSGGNP